MGATRGDAQIAGIAALDEPARRALYNWVVARGGAVSRDQAAQGTGISRSLAAFHLDRLVAAGLLAASYRRLSGRTGPGAGRPAKLYSRSGEQVDVTLPPRRYGLVAELFAEALEPGGGRGARELKRVARAFGRRLAQGVERGAGQRRGRSRGAPALLAALEELGYEPVRGPAGEVRLRNCPFHALTRDHQALVCGANLALLGGFAAEAQGERRALRAVLDPQPGMCCVVLRPEGGAVTRRPGRGPRR
jgi:predicted ArsR family transcriptional regulator